MEDLNIGISEEILENETLEAEVVESMDDYKDEIERSFKRLHVGDIVSGTILKVLDDQVLVDIGSYAEGTVMLHEISNDPSFMIHSDIEEGQKVNVLILKMDDGNGNLVLSIKKAEDETAWDSIKSIYETKEIVTVKISQIVNGGVVGYLKGIRAFIPASQLSVNYVEALEAYLNKEVEVRVINFDPSQKKVVLSGKEVEKEKQYHQKRQRLFQLSKGDYIEGTVKKLMDFGAFIDLGGIDGLIRNQDLAWERIKHPSEIVKEGETVKVLILDIDLNNEKIGLALKDVKSNPAEAAAKELKIGSVVNGIVEKLTTYGAFVKIGVGLEGLLHISEIADSRVNKPSDVLTIGQEISVKILDIQGSKISLSMKEAILDKERELHDEFITSEEVTTSLGDMLSKFNL